ncbi:MAG: arginase family protein [Promethearchaeota archaeon]|nr:MAG: arginase family protein [Candidatus Lokiarchaeota archaeon]
MNFFDFGEIIENNTEFVIFGIPWDYLTSIQAPNSAIAPKKIREVTENLALTTELGFDIPNIKAVDIGDVKIEAKNVDKNLNEIKTYLDLIYQQKSDIIPIMIGGDHFCSLNVIKAVGDHFKKKEEFGVLIFDSHLDFYEEWDKGVYSHATISHRVFDLDYINNKNLFIVGTRDIDIPELENAKKEGIGYLDAYLIAEIGIKNYVNKIISFYKKSNIKNLYVSIDIDALDPSIAPGTGFAIPGGFSYREMWQILRELTNHFNIQAFDVVEVAPNLDLPNNITSNLAAKLIVEFMSFIANKN